MRLHIARQRYGRPSPPPPGSVGTYAARVADGATDDIEEVLDPADDSLFPTSNDLELGHDNERGAQAVGIRFVNVGISQGETIDSAFLQFVSNEASQSVGCIVRIWCEDIDDAPVFEDSVDNVSNRTKTTASVDWTIPTWSTDGQEDVDTKSPDLSSLVQEVVNRVGWSAGNALAFIIETSPNNTSTTPRRAAKSRDLGSGAAPLLTINGGAETGGSGGGTSPSSYSLLGDASFDRLNLDNSETDANDMTLRGYYDELLAAGTAGTYDEQFDSPDVRSGNREGRLYVLSLLFGLRLVGDLQLLDEAIRLMELWYSNFTLDGNGYLHSDDTHPDDHDQSLDVRLQAGLFAHVMWACEVNKSLTSPAGHDYAAIASKYHTWLVDDYLPRWRGLEGTRGPDGMEPDGQDLRHPYVSLIAVFEFCRRMGGGGGFTVSQWESQATWSWDHVFESSHSCSDGYQNRTVEIIRHKAEEGTTTQYQHLNSYTRYTFSDLLHLWMEGTDDRLNDTYLTHLSNAFADFSIDGTSFSDAQLARYIGGFSDHCGVPAGSGTDRIPAGSTRWHFGGWAFLEGWDSRGRIVAYGEDRRADSTSSDRSSYPGYATARIITRYVHGW